MKGDIKLQRRLPESMVGGEIQIMRRNLLRILWSKDIQRKKQLS